MEGTVLYLAKHYLTHGLRTRASQILTSLIGPTTQRQHQVQADRLVSDGVTKSADDPDNVARPPAIVPQTGTPRRQPPVTPQAGRPPAPTAGQTRLRHLLQARQQGQQHGQGWGF